MSKNPNFMCIGPEKTGTSWLYKNLRVHPQVFLPAVKEIRYFWEKSYLPEQDISQRLTNSHWHNELYRNYLTKRVDFYQNNAERMSIENPKLVKQLIWDFKYLLLPRDDDWYFSLFAGHDDCITGDITPLYYQLLDDKIKHISEILPDLKIIILLRNPIDRAWSKAKMNLCQHKDRKLDAVEKAEFYNHFAKEYEQLSSYVSLINSWRKYFKSENIYVGYYDKLVREPSALFDEVCNFLNIEADLLPAEHRNKLSARVNKGVDINLPEEYSTHLAKMYDQCIKELAATRQQEPYPQQWLKSINKASFVSN